jgi:hypothetical protein
MARAGKYFVHVTTDEPPIYYDNSGKGYTLRGAKNFARIGSGKRKNGTWGEDRAVTRGLRGPLIRVYHHGQREWPVYREQLDSLKGVERLTRNETPSDL